MQADIKQWGNSLAIRLNTRELRRLGVNLGDRVEVIVRPLPQRIRDDLPVFRSGLRDVSERHDHYLYGDGP